MIGDFTAIDIETTGLDPKTDKIIEIGAIKVRNGQIEEEFESLVSPGRCLEEVIVQLTGINEEMLRDAPMPAEVIPKLIEFVGEDVILGHSVLFDYSFLKRAAVNLGLKVREQALGIDTLKIARHFLPNLESRSLPFLCNYYQIPLKAHRASEDARATAILYQKLVENFGDEKWFAPYPLKYEVKREAPASEKQKEKLYNLVQKHKLVVDYDIDRLTRNEASRYTDKIILKYGRL